MKTPTKKSGFTLIEIMICIAIVAILFTAGLRAMSGYHWLTREAYYSSAVRQVNIQKKLVDKMPFDSLSPQVLTIPDEGQIQLAHSNILEDSIKLSVYNNNTNGFTPMQLDSSLLNVDIEKGTILFLDPDMKGKKVVVKYDFLLPDYGEPVTVPKNAPYDIELFNSPAKSIVKIELVENNKCTEIPLHKVTIWENSGKIGFDKEYAGKVVRVTYIGGIIKNICSGEFLDDDLVPSIKPTQLKMVQIRESYNGKEDIKTGVLKVRK